MSYGGVVDMLRLHDGRGTDGWRDMTAHLRTFLVGEFRTSGSPQHEMKTVFELESETKGLPCLAGQSLFQFGLHIVSREGSSFWA